MAMSHEKTVKNLQYKNWLRSGLGLKYLKEGLRSFVTDIIKDQHGKFVANLQPCSTCSQQTLLPPHALKVGRNCSLGRAKCLCIGSKHTVRTHCPINVCGQIYDKIVFSHSFEDPNFSNTDITKWVTEPWELAKCYINKEGYRDKTSAEDTDCLGILSVIINNLEFQGRIESTTIDRCIKVRQYRNDVMHSSDLEVTDANLKTYIEDMNAILVDKMQLRRDSDAQQGRQKLKKLLETDIHISTEDEMSIIREAQRSLETYCNSQKECLQEISQNLDTTKEIHQNRFESIEKTQDLLRKAIDDFNNKIGDQQRLISDIQQVKTDLESMKAEAKINQQRMTDQFFVTDDSIKKLEAVLQKMNRNTEDEQAEELLDYLPKSDQGAQTFDLFCEAPIADSQGNIVKTYLRPDNDDTVRESNSKEAGLQETAGNSREESASEGKGSKCSESSSEVDFCKDGERVVGSPSSMVPIAIREEFQQNLYRRSIEPRSLQHSQSADCFQSNLEHEARFLYQNSLRNPSSVLNSQGWGRTEKENQLLNLGVPVASIAKVMGDHYSPRIPDPFVSKDGASTFPLKSMSSKDYPEKFLAQSPNVFSVNPQKEIITSSISNGSRSNLESFSVYERDSVGPFSQPVFSDSRLNGSPIDKYVVRHSNNESNLNSISTKDDLERNEVSSGKLNYNLHREGFYNTGVEKGIHHSLSSPALQKMYHSPSRYTSETSSRGVYSGSPASRGDYSGSPASKGDYSGSPASKGGYSGSPASKGGYSGLPAKHLAAQHDLIEMPIYIEVNSTAEGSLHRRMVPFPSHISTLPASRHPDLQTEELLRGENIGSPRLLRNDSVDTMVKRPLSEQQETVSKRFREDVDTCSIQNIPRPEKLTTLKVFDKFEQQVIKIPVIDEPVKKHSSPTVVIEADKHLEKSQRSSLLGAMDDPEIDLTDGPISVSVELSTRQFYQTHYKQAYAMRRIPRGKALIMNVNEVVGKSARRGTDIDRDNLHNLLCQMHFDVVVYNDSDGLTTMEMVQKLQQFSHHPAHANADCTIICILSHGEEGYIFGADGKKFELDAVFSLFDNTCCPNLRGKPKVFIIQTCRGGALDRGVQYFPDEHDGADARVRQVPSMSDMLICYPTQNGYYAWRNRDRGSWYVEALVQIFMKYARCEDICTMLNRVNLLVSKKVSDCPNIDMDQMSQMSEYKSTLRMPHLYFFPGIGGCS